MITLAKAMVATAVSFGLFHYSPKNPISKSHVKAVVKFSNGMSCVFPVPQSVFRAHPEVISNYLVEKVENECKEAITTPSRKDSI